ncbi:MAG: hypothetical protein ACE5E5_05395 [Phycisphaerae bacterium]
MKVVEITMDAGLPVTTAVLEITDSANPQSGAYGIDLNDAGDLGVVSFRGSDSIRVFDPVEMVFLGSAIPMEFTACNGSVVFGDQPKQLVIEHTPNWVDPAGPDDNIRGIPDNCEGGVAQPNRIHGV